ncbi:MAG: alkaline phosphatase D family protein [Hyphomonadaceae bacterium]|nr:alkaline phosphatase D family protein [Hyphomonadaceae bacterium]
MLIARRGLLAAGATAVLARPAWAQSLSDGAFTHGVASGDPLPDGIILWTRFVGGDGRIAYEISEDESFTRITVRGEARADPATDFCAKIDVRGLAPGRSYFYRFLANSGPSLTGRTRTAPLEAQSLSVGLVSCANYAFGHFHAYGHLAQRDDIDLVLHTGDYIYEYGADEYPRTELAVPGRAFDPDHEIITLNDYYTRYAQYHTDPNLQALRAAKPISAVWDDHEIANDSTSTGAQNHQRNEGAYADRVAAATKAYFDWMPIRRPEPNGVRIYRSLEWGDLARIILIDTRLIGRIRQLDYRRNVGALRLIMDGPGTAAAVEDFRRTLLNDPTRTLLGAGQEAWVAQQLAESKQRGQTWQILAQQIAMGEQLVGEGAAALVSPDAHANVRRYVTIAERLGRLRMPWNLDAWDGYPAARTRFLQACVANAANAVILGGDSHNTWVNNLASPDEPSRMAAIEFAGASVTSPGLEQALAAGAPGAREAIMRSANSHLAWCDVTNRGYGALRFTRAACEAEWVAFDDVRDPVAGTPSITRLSATPSTSAGPGAWALQA